MKVALRFYRRLDKHVRQKIVDKLDLLLSDPTSLKIKKLEGYNQTYRIRIGTYRIIFRVKRDSKRIVVCLIGHRQKVYKLLKHINITNLT